MGWRQIGDNEERLDQKQCRSLDFLVDGAQALQNALRKGSTLDGIGGEEFCWKEVWCPEVLWTPADAISNIKDAYNTLRRLNAIEEVMDSLSSSLKDAIAVVSAFVVRDSRETGLARLPDDVLAQIFELCRLRETLSHQEKPPSFQKNISSVCKRFRRVAIHLPLLWRNVSSSLSDHTLSVHKSRCQHPHVDLNFDDENVYSSEQLLDEIHPHDRWEEFRLRYSDIRIGHEFFQIFGPRVQAPFASLKRLFIESDGVDLQKERQFENVDEDEEEAIQCTILEEDEATLASWQCPNLARLHLTNITPSTFIQCSNVTNFGLALNSRAANIYVWDLRLIRNFLQSMPKLEVLSLNFEGDMGLEGFEAGVEPLTLPHLTTLRLFFSGFAGSGHVGRFLDILDVDTLTTLLVYLELDETKRREEWVEDEFSFHHNLRREDIGAWMWNVFGLIRRRDEVLGDRRDRTRPFPNVIDFSLSIDTVGYVEHPLFNPMFEALPNVRDLKLSLPDNFGIDLMRWMEQYGGLHELRTMRVQENRPHSPSKYTEFFRKFSEMEQWETFEELQVVCSSESAFCTENFEECVGDKLVWAYPRW